MSDPAPSVAGHALCRLDDIEDGEGRGFTLGAGAAARDIFVIRQGRRAFAYVNSCPHQGTPLDWTPDRFISDDSGLILCATHGAQFAVADGLCVSGPCIGARLQSLPVKTDAQGRVILMESPDL